MVNLIKYKNIPIKDKPPTNQQPIPLSVVPPQQSLTPIFNSPFYLTPDEPADPRDCDRYPDSLYCGGFPWSWTPIGIEPSIVLDECNVGIELKPIIGWTILPPIQIVYRKQTEECRIKKPPTPDPQEVGDSPKLPPPECPNGDYAGLFYVKSRYYKDEKNEYDYGNQPGYNSVCGYGSEATITTVKVNSFIFPYKDPNKVYDPVVDREESYVSVTETVERVVTGDYYCHYGHPPGYVPPPVPPPKTYQVVTGNISGVELGSYADLILGTYERQVRQYNWGSQYSVFNKPSNYPLSWTNLGESLVVNPRDTIYYAAEFGILLKSNCPEILPFAPPPPQLEKRCNCIMTCCPSTTQNDQLLRSLIQKVDKLSKIVGVEDYPISLPTSLISKDEGFFGNLIPNKNMNVPSLTRLAAWYIERFDEIMGQWEIPIEIKDSDPSKPGEQPVGIKLPNMAEAVAEMFTLCFQTNINTETLLNAAIRNLAETGADKQQNFVTYKLLQSLTDWVGYKQKDISEKMPLSFTLNKTRYDQILQESEVNVPVIEFDEKFGLEADLMRFREAAAILQANHKVKIDPNGNVKAQILKYLLDSFKSINKVNGDDTEQDFEDFLEQVEQGFINTRGVTNNTKPYGKPFNERPRIKDLTNFETDNPTP